MRKPRAPSSTVPIPHDAADELHFDDFLAAALTTLIGALQLLCVLNRREFDGPISPFKKNRDTLIKGPILSGRWPASYKTLIKVSCHLQHSFLEIAQYYVEGGYINRPARSKAASPQATGTAGRAAVRLDRAHIPPLWHRGCW
eukprot:COSAG01_NODE_587_length_15149_cov_13.592558_6_plen_143_part_00